MSSIAVFIYSAIFSSTVKKYREDKRKFAFIVSATMFALTAALNNEAALSLNPMFYLPFAVVSLNFFSVDLLILGVIVPVVFGFLGFFVVDHALSELGIGGDPERELGVELQMIKTKQIVFDV